MATLSSTVTISDPAEKDPRTGYGGGGVRPPAPGGGGGDRGGNGSPDYGQRLRRTRLGLLVGLIYGAIYALASYVEPTPREMTVTVPRDILAKPR